MSLNRVIGKFFTGAVIALALGLFGGCAHARAPYESVEIAPGLYSFGTGMAFNAFMITDDA